MFYISLPYFYENYKFNQFFKNYIIQSYRSKTFKLIDNFNIDYSYGSFPWSLWNGSNNNHQGQAVLFNDMQNIIFNTQIPLRLDASNIFLNENDYLDIHENAVLKIINGTNTTYEISDMKLMSYISKYNLNNKFIISNNAQILHLFDEDILNTFSKQDSIELINIGYSFNQIDLNQIQNKNKIEISIGHCQNCDFNTQLSCIYKEQQYIYNYSGQSNFINCPMEYKPTDYYKEIKPYLKQGIQHFKIITNTLNLNEFNINIIKSFIKPEYVGECIYEYYQSLE